MATTTHPRVGEGPRWVPSPSFFSSQWLKWRPLLLCLLSTPGPPYLAPGHLPLLTLVSGLVPIPRGWDALCPSPSSNGLVALR